MGTYAHGSAWIISPPSAHSAPPSAPCSDRRGPSSPAAPRAVASAPSSTASRQRWAPASRTRPSSQPSTRPSFCRTGSRWPTTTSRCGARWQSHSMDCRRTRSKAWVGVFGERRSASLNRHRNDHMGERRSDRLGPARRAVVAVGPQEPDRGELAWILRDVARAEHPCSAGQCLKRCRDHGHDRARQFWRRTRRRPNP